MCYKNSAERPASTERKAGHFCRLVEEIGSELVQRKNPGSGWVFLFTHPSLGFLILAGGLLLRCAGRIGRPRREIRYPILPLQPYLRRSPAYATRPPPTSNAAAGASIDPIGRPPLLGRSCSTIMVVSFSIVISCAIAVGTRISMATRATITK